jgi:DNA polymerase III sliding clamp (beta) subunit (PCNA family)
METTHTVGAQELGRVLHNAALFASKDTYRPILCGIEVSINGKIEATGTDSYRLGHDECPTLTGSGEATMVLEAKDVAAIAKELLKAHERFEVTVTTRPADSETTEVTIAAGNRIWVLKSVYGTFPQWRMLIPAEYATGEVSTIGLNADMLASFAKVKSDASPKGTMRLRFLSPTKPVVVNIGTSFSGVQMPVRMSN